MSERLQRLEELTTRVADRLGSDGGILVLRHSVRAEIGSAEVAAALAAPLLAEGRELARRLGEQLPGSPAARLFWSPVPRCQETAEMIAKGALGAGARATLMLACDCLGALYVLDPEAVTHHFASLGQEGFLRAWLGGELPATAISSAAEAGRALLAELLRTHQPGRLDLHITHDLTLITLLALVTDPLAEGFRWPGYLEGVLLKPRGGELLWEYNGSQWRSQLDGGSARPQAW